MLMTDSWLTKTTFHMDVQRLKGFDQQLHQGPEIHGTHQAKVPEDRCGSGRGQRLVGVKQWINVEKRGGSCQSAEG